MPKTGRYKPKNLKKQMEAYLQKILNVNRESRREAHHGGSFLEKAKPLSSLASKTIRLASSTAAARDMPGPGTYEPALIKTTQASRVQKFGTLAKRDSLMIRDVTRSPFRDPTFKVNPSPATYNKTIVSRNNATFLHLSSNGHSSFASKQRRDYVLESIGRGPLETPGPGAYTKEP
jgi:hypothetical protein